jgi:hypothetical protein
MLSNSLYTEAGAQSFSPYVPDNTKISEVPFTIESFHTEVQNFITDSRDSGYGSWTQQSDSALFNITTATYSIQALGNLSYQAYELFRLTPDQASKERIIKDITAVAEKLDNRVSEIRNLQNSNLSSDVDINAFLSAIDLKSGNVWGQEGRPALDEFPKLAIGLVMNTTKASAGHLVDYIAKNDKTSVNSRNTLSALENLGHAMQSNVARLIANDPSLKSVTNTWDEYMLTYAGIFNSARQAMEEDFEKSQSLHGIDLRGGSIHEQFAFIKRKSREEILELVSQANEGVTNVNEAEKNIADLLVGTSIWEPLDANKYVPNTLDYMRSDIQPGNRADAVPVTDVYLKMFASTAVYTPFVSKIGDVDYLAALKYLVGGEEWDTVKKLFSEASTYKKPLYMAVDSSMSEKSGTLGYSDIERDGPVERLTLDALNKGSNTAKPIVCVMLKGRLLKDGDAWTYYNYEIINDGGAYRLANIKLGDADSIQETAGFVSHSVLEMDQTMGNSRVESTSTTFTLGSLTSFMIYNCLQDQMLRSYWEGRLTEQLYMDFLGNVLLYDGTVVVPAASNPVFTRTISSTEGQSSSVQEDVIAGDTLLYNPFTVAFWNSYPMFIGSEAVPSTMNKKDGNKLYFKLYRDSDSTIDTRETGVPLTNLANISKFDKNNASIKIYPKGSDDFSLLYRVAIFDLKKNETNRIASQDTEAWSSFVDIFPYFATKEDTSFHKMTVYEQEVKTSDDVIAGGTKVGYFGGIGFWQENVYPIGFTPIVVETVNTHNPIMVFPYERHTGEIEEINTTDSAFSAAEMIANNMYIFLTAGVVHDPNTGVYGNGTLREDFMTWNVMNCVFDGIYSSTEYEKSRVVNSILFQESTNIIGKFITYLAQGVAKFGKSITGLIGIAPLDSTSGLTLFYFIMTEYWGFVFFIGVILLLIIFMKTHSATKTLVSALILFGVGFIMLYLSPRILPFIISNPLSKLAGNISSQVALYRGEQYGNLHSADMDYEIATLKLYDMSMVDAKELREIYNYGNTSTFMTDNLWLNSEIGVFARGTEIRLNLRKYWQVDNFVSEWDSTSTPPHYKLKRIENRASQQFDLINYYTPLTIMEDGFTEKLNLFSSYYSSPRSTITYPDGFSKDSYIVYNYTRSYPFLAVLDQVQAQLPNLADTGVIASLQAFKPYGDNMNLYPWLVERDWYSWEGSGQEETLWLQTLYSNGYYDAIDGKMRRQNLAEQVNLDVYDFMMSVSPQIGLISDENLIRATALQAAISFNTHVSRFGKMLYPRYISLDEFNVTDILTAAILPQSARYMYYDVDLMSNIAVEKGIFGLIIASFTIVTAIAIAVINKYFLFLLYIFVLFIVIYLVFTNKSIAKACGVFIRGVLFALALNLATCLALVSYPMLPYNLNLYLLFIMLGLILYGAWQYIKHLLRYALKEVPVLNRFSNAANTIGAQPINIAMGIDNWGRNIMHGTGVTAGLIDEYIDADGNTGEDEHELEQRRRARITRAQNRIRDRYEEYDRPTIVE